MGINIILDQITTMYLLMAVGYYMAKKGWLNKEGTKQLSSILLKVVVFVVIVNAFNIKFSLLKLRMLILTFILAFIILGIGFVMAHIFFKGKNRLEQAIASFPNVGFFGIPLVRGLLGDEAVFFLTMVIVVYNIYSWTYGVYLISGNRESIKFEKLFTTPAFMGFWIGLIIFIFPFALPNNISKSLAMIANINTTLAMFILGSYIAECSLVSIVKERIIIKISAVKLLIIPLISILILSIVPNYYNSLKMVILIAISAPSGVTMAMFAQQYKADYAYGAKIISLTTLLSIITIPAILTIAVKLWL